MQRLLIEQLKPGMVVSRNIFINGGELLIGAGSELNSTHVERLSALGFASIYVLNSGRELIGFELGPEVITEELRVETVRTMKDAFVEAAGSSMIDITKATNSVHAILQEILANDDFLFNLMDIRSLRDYLFGHSVNVCVLSLMTGLTMGYPENRLKELGMGALLHDLGHCFTPKSLLNKTSSLTVEEIDEIRMHSANGFQVLRKQQNFSLLAAHVAFQHHERWDGKGYPRHLGKRDIHEYARIVAAADVFDALMSDRPFRPAYDLQRSLKIVRGLAGSHLDPHCVEALLANVSVYALGSLVELNNGSLAIVTGVSRQHPARPTVQVIYDSCRKATRKKHSVDLKEYSTVFIRRVLSENEVIEMVSGCCS